MIVGTAGHIDHGKTSLVQALTGVDTDRLKEEKERGISIELGYAYTPLPNGDILGFVDVPGHERLVHTMVAGACGIDFALLVVAADDGVMPQTREHVTILELLGIARGAVALTKVDRVTEERRQEVAVEISELLKQSPLRDAPIFPTNATAPDDTGTTALRHHLHQVALSMPARDDQGLFRLAVDRVFTLPGHGTIVAGTVFSGKVATGDTVLVMPGNVSARIRSIHTQNRPSDQARVGDRCAVNLAGVEKEAVSRGDWLGDPRALVATQRIDVRMQLLASNRLPPRSSIHVHIGAAHCLAQLMPLDSTPIASEQAALVQLVLESPTCALPGDRFILRDAQAAHTIGGGVVLDPSPPQRKRRSVQRLFYLNAVERMLAGDGLAQVLANAPHSMTLSALERLTGRPADHIALPPDSVVKTSSEGRFVLIASVWNSLRQRLTTALREFHTEFAEEPGPDSGRLRRIVCPELPTPLWQALIDELAHEQVIARNGPWLQMPGHVLTLSDPDRALAQQLQSLIAAGKPEPPWVRDLAATVREPEARVRRILLSQVAQGRVCQIVHDLFYDSDRVGTLADAVASLARAHGSVDAARYRDTVGLGRKRSIQILEYFDRVGYTRRVHDVHVLRADSGWTAAKAR